MRGGRNNLSKIRVAAIVAVLISCDLGLAKTDAERQAAELFGQPQSQRLDQSQIINQAIQGGFDRNAVPGQRGFGQSSQFGGQGGAHAVDGQGQFGLGADPNQQFHQNHLQLFQVAIQTDPLGTTDASLLNDIVRGVDGIRAASINKDTESGKRWASWIWNKLRPVQQLFLDKDKNIQVDRLGQALCVDGQVADGSVQPFFEQSLKAAKLPVTGLGRTVNYNPAQEPAAGTAQSAIAGVVAGDVAPPVPKAGTQADTAGSALEHGHLWSPVRGPHGFEDSVSGLGAARPPRNFNPEDIPMQVGFPGCALVANPFINNNDQQQADRDKNANKNAKAPGNGAGDPPPPGGSPPSGGGGGGGKGGDPGKLDPVKMNELQAYAALKLEKAPDEVNLLAQIKAAGEFVSNYDFSKIIKQMEMTSLQYMKAAGDIIASMPIVAPVNDPRGKRKGNGGPGGSPNADQLDAFASALGGKGGGSSGRSDPFNSVMDPGL